MSTQVITGLVRFSYANVFTPKAAQEGGKLKYSVSLIIPKSDTFTLDRIKAAIAEATEQGKASKWGGKVPPKLKLPLRDGDEERPDDEAYKNAYFVNASSDNRPAIVGKNPKEHIINADDFVSGDYGRASINFYPFDASGNKGVACGLNNLQKLKDGEPLAGGTRAEDDFAEVLEIEGDDLL